MHDPATDLSSCPIATILHRTHHNTKFRNLAQYYPVQDAVVKPAQICRKPRDLTAGLILGVPVVALCGSAAASVSHTS